MKMDDGTPGEKQLKKRPRSRPTSTPVQYSLDDRTARLLQAAAKQFHTTPDKLLWLLVRHGLKPYAFNGRLPKPIIEALAESAARDNGAGEE